MTWPQIVTVVWLVFGLLFGLRGEVINRSQSSDMATLGILFRLAFTAGAVGVLHAGGFW